FPTDFSPASNAALRYAMSLAEQSDALLLVLHVQPASTPPLGSDSSNGALVENEAALVRLITQGSSSDKGLGHEFRALHGDPATDARATDVHIDPSNDDFEVRLRIDGRLEHYCRLQREVAQPLITQLKVMAEIDLADPFHPNEGRISLSDALGGYEVRMTKVP